MSQPFFPFWKATNQVRTKTADFLEAVLSFKHNSTVCFFKSARWLKFPIFYCLWLLSYDCTAQTCPPLWMSLLHQRVWCRDEERGGGVEGWIDWFLREAYANTGSTSAMWEVLYHHFKYYCLSAHVCLWISSLEAHSNLKGYYNQFWAWEQRQEGKTELNLWQNHD